MLIKRALNKESLYEISLKLDEKTSRGISYSSQIVFFQFLHYTCFSSAIYPLQVPAHTASYARSAEEADQSKQGNLYKVVLYLAMTHSALQTRAHN